MNHGLREPQLREYRCTTCGQTELAQVLPEGWCTVQGSTDELRPKCRLGIFCTPRCVANAAEQLDKTLRAHLRRFGLTDDTQDLVRQMQDAAILFNKGHSIKQLSDLFQKPTKSVSKWLCAAGLHTVTPPAAPKQHGHGKARSIPEHLARGRTRSARSLLNELEQL